MSKFLEMMGNLSEEQTARLGKHSTRLNTAGTHVVTIKNAYETTGEYPRLVLEFATADGLSINWSGFLIGTDYNTKEKVQDLKVFGYFMNIHKAAFGADFKISQLGKGISEGTTTNAAKVTTPTTVYNQLIGKKVGIATYTEITAKDKKNKADPEVFRNQAIDIKHVFNDKLLEVSELAAGITEGTIAAGVDANMKATFKIGSGFKDHKFVKQELIVAQGGTAVAKTDTPVSTEIDPFN